MENNTLMGNTNVRRAIVAVIILLALFLFAQSAKTFKSISYLGKDVPAMNTISVNGTGEVFAKPDVATFSFTVQDESLVIKTSQDTVNKSVSDILAYLEKNGVAEKDIKTTNYNVYPRYEYNQIQCFAYPCPRGKQVLAGYVVTQSISVKVRTLSDAGELVTGIGEMGATEISGLAFSVDEDEALLREARQKAIEDAKAKAKELAKDLGVRIVRVVNYSEGGNYPMYYSSKALGVGMGGDMASAPPAEIPAGENQFISNVTITYEIR